MRIYFIRHGKTQGNLEKRYIGRTDESLCEAGINELRGRKYPDADIAAVSPMKRCVETAHVIYPNKKIISFDGFRECDFGSFEGRNYSELNGDEYYQRWIDSGGTLPFPCGESVEGFKRRCIDTFDDMIKNITCEKLALIVHGGTIMSVLEKYAVPQKTYYDYMIKNAEYYITEYDGERLRIIENEDR